MPTTVQVTVETAGTPVAASESSLRVSRVLLQAPSSNSGTVFLGTDELSISPLSGLIIELGPGQSEEVTLGGAVDADGGTNLADLLVDAEVSGDQLFITAI